MLDRNACRFRISSRERIRFCLWFSGWKDGREGGMGLNDRKEESSLETLENDASAAFFYQARRTPIDELDLSTHWHTKYFGYSKLLGVYVRSLFSFFLFFIFFREAKRKYRRLFDQGPRKKKKKKKKISSVSRWPDDQIRYFRGFGQTTKSGSRIYLSVSEKNKKKQKEKEGRKERKMNEKKKKRNKNRRKGYKEYKRIPCLLRASCLPDTLWVRGKRGGGDNDRAIDRVCLYSMAVSESV